jgi:hypothetical protein
VAQFETRLGPVLDAEFRRDAVQKAYGSVFASLLERATEMDLSTRASVLSELNFPSVVLFKEVNDESLQRFLQRVGARIAKDLRNEFPDAGVTGVQIARQGDVRVQATGADEAAVQVRATELWNARSESLTSIRL